MNKRHIDIHLELMRGRPRIWKFRRSSQYEGSWSIRYTIWLGSFNIEGETGWWHGE
jgi:hypothetical protein